MLLFFRLFYVPLHQIGFYLNLLIFIHYEKIDRNAYVILAAYLIIMIAAGKVF